MGDAAISAVSSNERSRWSYSKILHSCAVALVAIMGYKGLSYLQETSRTDKDKKFLQHMTMIWVMLCFGYVRHFVWKSPFSKLRDIKAKHNKDMAHMQGVVRTSNTPAKNTSSSKAAAKRGGGGKS